MVCPKVNRPATLAGRDVGIGEIVQGAGASFAIVQDAEGNRIVVLQP